MGTSSPLARYLCATYVALIGYASLYPLSGWRDAGVPPLAFLDAFWPQYYTGFDLVANVLAYMPFGVLAVAALHPYLRGAAAVALTVLAGAALSLGMETLQNYLPTRIPSTLDFALNVGGSAAGALIGVVLAPRLIGHGVLYRLRHRVFAGDRTTDPGLVLCAGWLIALLRPESLLFGNGDLRFLFDTLPGVLHDAALFVRVEAMVTGANIVVVALLLSLLLAERAPARRLFLLLLASACLIRTLAFAVLFGGGEALSWLTPGAVRGLLVGTPLALLAAALRGRAAAGLCGLLLMAATALVNLAPDNPYLVATHQLWEQGQFLNFNGLTRLVSTLWPFAALAFVLWSGGRGESAERARH